MSEHTADSAPWEDPLSPSSDSDLSADASDSAEPIPPEKAPLINEIAIEFIGFWNRLISQTNWEKGKVIYSWRTRLVEAGLPRSVYSDEAIAQRIGGISSQHVGRLRRVYEKFGADDAPWRGEEYKSLYWSHFQAALDWDDAPRWLKKASVEALSVAQMRIARWEEYGAPADRKPKESDIVASEPDEDVNPRNDSQAEFLDTVPVALSEDKDEAKKSAAPEETPSPDDEKPDNSALLESKGSDEPWTSPVAPTGEILRAMGDFPALPDDLARPIAELKEAILNHKVSGWADVSQNDLVVWLGALRGLVLSRK
ncbi:MAG: hypothetical protein IK105_02105 [Thermoguttaceae bacterium]|nr:hypothetical protein [Thermoguttaceae bacterium]MBR6480720.1 hypothetical protein [Thermoguttaceae bacterium]